MKFSSRVIPRNTGWHQTLGPAQSYATLHILAAAIASAQSIDSTPIRDALANTMDLDTVLGQFSFDAVGDAVYDPQILIVKDGEFAVFE